MNFDRLEDAVARGKSQGARQSSAGVLWLALTSSFQMGAKIAASDYFASLETLSGQPKTSCSTHSGILVQSTAQQAILSLQ